MNRPRGLVQRLNIAATCKDDGLRPFFTDQPVTGHKFQLREKTRGMPSPVVQDRSAPNDRPRFARGSWQG